MGKWLRGGLVLASSAFREAQSITVLRDRVNTGCSVIPMADAMKTVARLYKEPGCANESVERARRRVLSYVEGRPGRRVTVRLVDWGIGAMVWCNYESPNGPGIRPKIPRCRFLPLLTDHQLSIMTLTCKPHGVQHSVVPPVLNESAVDDFTAILATLLVMAAKPVHGPPPSTGPPLQQRQQRLPLSNSHVSKQKGVALGHP